MQLINRTAGRLSRHRRGPLAGLAVLLLGLLISGSLYTAFAPAQAQNQASETDQIAQGKELFLASCAFCHGKNGEGVSQVRDGYQLGPSLVGVGAAAVDFQVSTGRMPLAQQGQQAERKPPVFNDEEVAALAAYVASLGPGPAIPADEYLEVVDDDSRLAEGSELFLVGCSFCHGTNGQGVKTLDGNQLGPSLAGVGAAAVDFQVSTGRMPMAQPGAQAPRTKPVYSEEEVLALAAYVASLGPGPAIPDAEMYDPETIPEDEREEAIVRGGEFFRTNCTACHNFAGAGGALPGGKYAPTLVGVEPVHIYEALITGPQQMPLFSDEVLLPEQKRDIIAYLQSIEEAPNYGGSGMGALGPVSEGLFAWLVGIGSLVGFAIWIASHTARSAKKGTSA